MLITTPLMSKSTFWGSLLQKCRQVVKSQKPSTTTNNTIKNTNNNNNFTPTINADTAASTNTPKTGINLSKTTTFNTNRPALLDITAANVLSSSSHISTSVVSLKSLEEKVGLPPRPKKPMTPYFRYMRDMRPKLQAENPKLNTQDIVRQLSKQWPTVDLKIKERLQNEFKCEQQVYVEQRAKYDAKITTEKRAEINKLKQEEREMQERRKLRQRVRELGRPKKPASAFLRFVKSERISTPQLQTQTFRDWHRKCAEKWARLSDAEKENFMKDSRIEMEAYKKRLVAWEEKMMAMGNNDVVRIGSQIDPPEPKPKKR